MSTTTKSISLAVVTLLIVIGAAYWLNRGYGKVSDQGYQMAMALMSICNRQDAERLAILTKEIEASQRSGELSQYDYRVLEDITLQAAAGNWSSAARAVRQLMEDQVEP